MSTLPIYNGLTSTSSNASIITWGGNTTSVMYPGPYTSGTGGLSNTTYNPVKVIVDIKRCRNCNHAHLAEQTGCIDQEGWNTIFVICKCKEYLPKDNLEYLEYLDKKKTSK